MPTVGAYMRARRRGFGPETRYRPSTVRAVLSKCSTACLINCVVWGCMGGRYSSGVSVCVCASASTARPQVSGMWCIGVHFMLRTWCRSRGWWRCGCWCCLALLLAQPEHALQSTSKASFLLGRLRTSTATSSSASTSATASSVREGTCSAIIRVGK